MVNVVGKGTLDLISSQRLPLDTVESIIASGSSGVKLKANRV